MKTQVRVLVLLTIVALGAGWAVLRSGNAALEARLASSGASGPEARPVVLCNHGTSWHTQSAHCHPTWSWDGSRILYASDFGGRVNLYLVRPQ